MTEQEFNALSLDDKIKLTNIVIGVVRKPSAFVDNKPLRYPVWLTPEADLFVKEKKK